jgi:hypothetical protein
MGAARWTYMLLLALPVTLSAQQPKSGLKWDTVVDLYYAYDFNRPDGGARSFATQPSRLAVRAEPTLARAQYTRRRPRRCAPASPWYWHLHGGQLRRRPQLFGTSARRMPVGLASTPGWMRALPSHRLRVRHHARNRSWSRSLIAENSPTTRRGSGDHAAHGAAHDRAARRVAGRTSMRQRRGGRPPAIVPASEKLLLNQLPG